MENFIKVSAHINKLLEYFGEHFNHASQSRPECLQVHDQSNRLHRKLVEDGDLLAYDQHLELAKSAYRNMLDKLNHQQIVDDILFCGSSELSWEESSCSLSNLYQLDLHSKEIYAFYYLHDINNQFYIDSPLPMRETVRV